MPDTGADSAQFTEMLQVDVDQQLFVQGLRQLETEYEAFLKRLSSKGVSSTDVFNTGNVAATSNALRQLATDINQVKSGIAETMSSLANTITLSLGQMTEVIESKFQLMPKAARAASEQMVEAEQEAFNRIMSEIGAGLEKQTSLVTTSNQIQARAFQTLFESVAAGSDVFTLLSDANKRWYDGYLRNIEGAITANAKLDETQKAQAAKEEERQARLVERAGFDMQRDFAQREAAAGRAREAADRAQARFFADLESAQAKEILLRQEAEAMKLNVTRQSEKVRAKEEGTASSRSVQASKTVLDVMKQLEAQRVEIARLAAQQRVAIEQGADDQIVRQFAQALNEMQRQANITGRQLQTAIKGEDKAEMSLFERAFGRLVKDLPEFGASMFRLVAGLQASYAVLNAIEAVLKIIPNAFREGFDHLTQMEAKAAELQGVIAGSVQYSKDLSENFRIAGQVAAQAAEELELAAARSGQSYQTLFSSLQTFLETGGGTFVTNMNEAVAVVTNLAIAMSKVTSHTQVERRLVEEIPKFLNGELEANSKILRALHMSKEQYDKMIESAKTQHNLLEQLEPAIRPFLSVQEQADLRMAVINEQLQHFKEVAEEALAKPMWDYWKGILQAAAQFWKEHQNQIRAIAASLGSMIVSLARFLGMIVDLVTVYLPKGGGEISMWGLVITGLIEAVNFLLNLFIVLGKFIAGIVELLFSGNLFKKDAWKAFLADAKNEVTKFAEETWQGILRISDAAYGTAMADVNKQSNDMMNKPFTGLGGPQGKGKNTSAINSELRDEFRNSLQRMNAWYDEAIEKVKEAEAAHTISTKEASEQIKTHLENEKASVLDLINNYLKLAKLRFGKDTKGFENFKRDLEGQFNTQSAKIQKDSGAQTVRAIKDEQNQKIAAYKHTLDMLRQTNAQELTAERQLVQQKAMLRSKALQDEIQRLRAEGEEAKYLFEAETEGMSRDSARYQQLQRDKEKADSARSAKVRQLAREVEQAQFDEAQAVRQQAVEAIKLKISALEKELQTERTLHGETKRSREIENELADLRVKEQDAILEITKNEIAWLEALALEVGMNEAVKQAIQERIDKLKEELAIRKELTDQQEGTNQKNSTLGGLLGGLTGDSKIKSFGDIWKTIKEGGQDLSDLIKGVSGTIQNISQAFKQGGIAGGIGNILSTVGGFIPGPVGAVMQIAGGILSAISGIFTSAAKKIAKQIAQDVGKILHDYNAGTKTMVETINDLEKKRAEAVQRLSGKKGGKDQLDKLLPEIDDKLEQLKKQQKEILENFDKQLAVLKTGSDTLGDFLRTWQEIVKTVKEYLNAGGDAVKAQEYLSLSLKKYHAQVEDQLRDAEKEAIQDAIKLNDLLKQRNDLVEEFKKKEFDLMNADALERRQSGAVTRGRELAQLREDYQKQLADIDSQIDLATKRVEKEKEVFDISSDIAELHRRDNELELEALDSEIQKVKDLKVLYEGIYQTQNGSWAIMAGLVDMLGIILNPTQAAVGGARYGGATYQGSIAGSWGGSQWKYIGQDGDKDIYIRTNGSPAWAARGPNGWMDAAGGTYPGTVTSQGSTPSLSGADTNWLSLLQNGGFLPATSPTSNTLNLNGDIVVNVSTSGTVSGTQLGSDIYDEIRRRARYGFGG